ncbi:MAG: carbohydrate ABC transporter substrate-binding protein [Opitutales bacterium]|nr:carbohydrate ABC transporter substrate-binding protein [Opitutales bacterium]MBT5813349.1 carbohydrate ABC transporter substrate-binding protein [Opitutales bacterium]MBT6381522.1 carbohydrate ABC transporter substrate-binding protein [Opitutales bacterium]
MFAGCGGNKEPDTNPSASIDDWIEQFQPSALSKEEQRAELEWFAKAAAPYIGMEIKSVAEGIKTHQWESEVLAKAFFDITGIKVTHDIIGEGEIVDRIQRQIQTNRKLYDIYVNDADLIGTHLRLDSALNLSEFIQGDGKGVTNPMLDLDDFLNLEFGQDYEGNQLQLPDQQFANLYWFRYDWFARDDLKTAFKSKYGYELGVPLNWQAYEDIAEFFTGREIDGQTVYGHMDYGKKSPSLGWRFTDAWLSMAGVGDKGLPNGLPVDEWGIRVENSIPVGSSVTRGGGANGPAAVYALTKYVDWMKEYAPPFAASMTWSEAGPVPARGNIAQRVFQYITWLSDDAFTAAESPVTDSDGKPLWRVAPSPHGKYWDEGMKVGYQDAGSWTILKNSVEGKDREAAWLWAQFCVSKSVSLKKFMIGKTPIRKSTVNSEYLAGLEGDFGGLITFYKSSVENQWTDSGPNVPHYPLLAEQWWQNIAPAVTGDVTPQQAMDNIAAAMDERMGKLEGKMKRFSPKLNPESSAKEWLNKPGAPKAERPDEAGETMAYDELIKVWRSQ